VVLLLLQVVRRQMWVVLLRVRIVLLLVVLPGMLVLVLVGAKAQMGEDAGDVMEHGCVYPPALLGEVGVVREVLADLVLLLAQDIDMGREVHVSPHDRVLITVSRRARRTHLRTIRILHT
jgi:hypothetical protein